MQDKFIYTSDEELKNKLIQSGYNLIQQINQIFIFENKNTMNFSKEDKTKFVTKDVLMF